MLYAWRRPEPSLHNHYNGLASLTSPFHLGLSGGSGAVGADEDVGAVPVGVGDPCESVVRHRDVIRGGIGSGVPGPEAPGPDIRLWSRSTASHPRTVSGDMELGARIGTLHAESAF